MATSYPYTSAQGSIVKAFEQFRKNFPTSIDAALLQKFSIAPANESYVINTFRFLGVIDDSGSTVDSVGNFFRGADANFQAGLDGLLKSAYSALYSEQGDSPWSVAKADLATWFRVTDKTSDLIGQRQAATYLTLASLAGHGEPAKAPAPTARPATKGATPAQRTSKQPIKPNQLAARGQGTGTQSGGSFGLTVRVEVNLPADGSQETYDAIFSSIRKNLLNP